MNLINANPCHNLQRYILLIYCSPLIYLCLVHTNELRSHNSLYSFFLYFAHRLTAFLSSSPYALAFYPLTSHILHQLSKHFYILRKRKGIFFLSPLSLKILFMLCYLPIGSVDFLTYGYGFPFDIEVIFSFIHCAFLLFHFSVLFF